MEGSRVYKLEYLPAVRRDMIEIVRYISKELNNPAAASRLAVELIEAGEGVLGFPYANPVYIPVRPLKHEYRKLLVQNYLMFYRVDEAAKLVTVARVIYAKRDYGLLLEQFAPGKFLPSFLSVMSRPFGRPLRFLQILQIQQILQIVRVLHRHFPRIRRGPGIPSLRVGFRGLPDRHVHSVLHCLTLPVLPVLTAFFLIFIFFTRFIHSKLLLPANLYRPARLLVCPDLPGGIQGFFVLPVLNY